MVDRQQRLFIIHSRKIKQIYLNFVQAKVSVIKRIEEYSNIVSRISRYANTQNKVNDADFTANNPYLVALEKLSRCVLTPRTENSVNQTYWFLSVQEVSIRIFV